MGTGAVGEDVVGSGAVEEDVVGPTLDEGMQHVDLKLPFPLGSPHFCAPCSKAKPEVHAPSPTVAQQLSSVAPFIKQALGSAAKRLSSQPETTLCGQVAASTEGTGTSLVLVSGP